MKKILFITIICLVLLAAGCSKKQVDPEIEMGTITKETTASSNDDEASPLLPVHVEREITPLPEKEEGDFTVDADLEIIRVPGSRIIADYPKGSTAAVKDEYNAKIKTDTGSCYYIHRFYNNNYTDTENIAKYSADAIKSLKYDSDGNFYKVNRFDSGKLTTVIDPVGKITIEQPSMVLKETHGSFAYPSSAVCYRFVGDDAYMVVAISLTESAQDINDVAYEITRSIRNYSPAAAAASIELTKPFSITDTVKILIPDNWEAKKDGDLTFCIPTDINSFYTGMEIYIFSDPQLKYCSDYLSLPTGMESVYIKHRYPTKQAYNYDTDVIDFDEVSEGGLNGYFFEIQNNLYPACKEAVVELPSCGTAIKSYAYTFEDPNGIPFVIGVSYADKNRDQVFTLSKSLAATVTTAISK